MDELPAFHPHSKSPQHLHRRVNRKQNTTRAAVPQGGGRCLEGTGSLELPPSMGRLSESLSPAKETAEGGREARREG